MFVSGVSYFPKTRRNSRYKVNCPMFPN
uniref:Uncharacterized protein n=1 Tax=Arundo donax TaxID=35708 RepID=A0A0A8YID3_ARUDO